MLHQVRAALEVERMVAEAEGVSWGTSGWMDGKRGYGNHW